ncbi:hypothetical protein B0J12DRAFT_148908 [Macrophomina phaseolina]|uniref:Fatty acid hydroxylase n=1 Tax=Macrophomina phaseolina TaxID=35725 RepID=A0ABQ8G6B1_9PEZI|nr:hypothetical protein B0J12DRAFT_148908 [Macrophomina phaseolina]
MTTSCTITNLEYMDRESSRRRRLSPLAFPLLDSARYSNKRHCGNEKNLHHGSALISIGRLTKCLYLLHREHTRVTFLHLFFFFVGGECGGCYEHICYWGFMPALATRYFTYRYVGSGTSSLGIHDLFLFLSLSCRVVLIPLWFFFGTFHPHHHHHHHAVFRFDRPQLTGWEQPLL